MTTKRLILATVLVFLLAQALGILIHGFILAGDYGPFYGTLLRPMEGSPGWQALLIPVSHLMVAAGIVWIGARLDRDGNRTARGLRLGLVAWLIGPGAMFLLWYAEQPWPGALVMKQLPLELAAMLLLGRLAARLTESRSAGMPPSPRQG
jgi:hypothetical protein